jgi:very-short-patch-repair endonuclease
MGSASRRQVNAILRRTAERAQRFRSALDTARACVDQDEEYPDQMPPLMTIGASAASALATLEASIRISKFTESPIETMLGVALFDVLEHSWQIIPQFKWRAYRIDWCLRRPDKTDIFIECDGKEFHSKPEDVARDRRRDAEIAKAGIKLFRFTGSEIFRNPKGCAFRVYHETLK